MNNFETLKVLAIEYWESQKCPYRRYTKFCAFFFTGASTAKGLEKVMKFQVGAVWRFLSVKGTNTERVVGQTVGSRSSFTSREGYGTGKYRYDLDLDLILHIVHIEGKWGISNQFPVLRIDLKYLHANYNSFQVKSTFIREAATRKKWFF